MTIRTVFATSVGSNQDNLIENAVNGTYEWDWLKDGRTAAFTLTSDVTLSLVNTYPTVYAFVKIIQDSVGGHKLTVSNGSDLTNVLNTGADEVTYFRIDVSATQEVVITLSEAILPPENPIKNYTQLAGTTISPTSSTLLKYDDDADGVNSLFEPADPNGDGTDFTIDATFNSDQWVEVGAKKDTVAFSIPAVDEVALAPPASPATGHRVIVADAKAGISTGTGTGAFANKVGSIMEYNGTAWEEEDKTQYPKNEPVYVDEKNIWMYRKDSDDFVSTANSMTVLQHEDWISLLNKFGAGWSTQGTVTGEAFTEAVLALASTNVVNKASGAAPHNGRINRYPTNATIDITKAQNFWDEDIVVGPDSTAWIQFENSQPFLIFHDAANPGNWRS